MTDAVLVIDIGTSSVRAGIVRADSSVTDEVHLAVGATTPAPGLVEFDPVALAAACLEVARSALATGGPVAAVGIANQRSSTIVWDRHSGQPVAPGIGWQDLRTVGTCLELQADGFRLSPNASATKVAAILDAVDPDRMRADDLCFGTVDSWVAWTLSGSDRLHITDATNAGVTGMVSTHQIAWNDQIIKRLAIPEAMLPAIVDTSGHLGVATALDGAPAICSLVGDQQASLVGQGCTVVGTAKATFGTGGMLDLCTGARPAADVRGEAGTFPIVAFQRDGVPTWGLEAMMLSAGTCVQWLHEDLQLIERVADSDALGAMGDPEADVWFVPALLGLGTPVWDFGARGTLIGLTRSTTKADIVRAVLEGVAQRGADLVDAAQSDGALAIKSLRVDGGMTANNTFLRLLADACGRPIEVSPVLEATTLGAGYLAGLAVGTFTDTDAIAAAFKPRQVLEPAMTDQAHRERRGRWLQARAKSEETIPALSGITF